MLMGASVCANISTWGSCKRSPLSVLLTVQPASVNSTEGTSKLPSAAMIPFKEIRLHASHLHLMHSTVSNVVHPSIRNAEPGRPSFAEAVGLVMSAHPERRCMLPGSVLKGLAQGSLFSCVHFVFCGCFGFDRANVGGDKHPRLEPRCCRQFSVWSLREEAHLKQARCVMHYTPLNERSGTGVERQGFLASIPTFIQSICRVQLFCPRRAWDACGAPSVGSRNSKTKGLRGFRDPSYGIVTAARDVNACGIARTIEIL